MQVELKNGETYNGHLVNCDVIIVIFRLFKLNFKNKFLWKKKKVYMLACKIYNNKITTRIKANQCKLK